MFRKRVPVFLQGELAECGLACLGMVAAYHGHQLDMRAVRQIFAPSTRGTTAGELLRMAQRLGLEGRVVRVSRKGVHKLKLPAILHFDGGHFVVLSTRQARGFTIHDPAIGRILVEDSRFGSRFGGVAVELWDGGQLVPIPRGRRLELWSLARKVKGLRGGLWYVASLSVALNAFALGSPYFLQLIMDHVMEGGDAGLLPVLVVGLLGVKVFTLILRAVRAWALIWIRTQLDLELMHRLMAHLLRLPHDWYLRRSQGAIASRFDSMTALNAGLGNDVVEAVLDGVLASLAVGVLFLYSSVLGSICVGATLLYAGIRALCTDHLHRSTLGAIEYGARLRTLFVETLRALVPIRMLNQEETRLTRWRQAQVASVEANVHLGHLGLGFSAAAQVIGTASQAAVVFIGCRLVMSAEFSIGMLYAYLAWQEHFSKASISLIDRCASLHMLGLHAERLADIVLATPESSMDSEGQALTWGVLEARNVYFRYGEREPWILENVNLRIEQGECVAIVAESGAGKTTLLKILCGLMHPTRGTILVDGKNLRSVGLARYRSQVAAVLQDDQLLSGTLAENIMGFSSSGDMARVEEAAKLAHVATFIEGLPMGYHSLVGDMGSALSGGQVQRILLARALYRRPSILFLDEATSHLDAKNEGRINDVVRVLGTTRVIVAHRQETISFANRVVRLEDLSDRIRGGASGTAELPPLRSNPAQLPSVLPEARRPASA